MTTTSHKRRLSYGQKLQRLVFVGAPIVVGFWIAVIGLLLKIFAS